MVILEARGVSFAYAARQDAAAQPDVVRGVDLAVREGEVICVLGPNGAGKSTLLRVLAGLLRPRVGDVQLLGRPIQALTARDRARCLGMVPQSLFSLPDLAVHRFVAQGRYAYRSLFGRPSSADRDAIDRALVEADLVELADRPLDALSGGQRQRALVARALAQEPRVVLVDEPTNSLDPRHQVQVFQVIAGLGCEGRAAVVVTHDLNLASQFATRLVLMNEGVVVRDGTVHDVLRPDVLQPVYGDDLAFGHRMAAGWGEERPFVLPWRQPPPPPDATTS